MPPIGTVEGKKPQIERMFDSIAPRYDLLNRVLSAGIDQKWRKKVIRLILEKSPQRVLDVATGTADLAIMAANSGVPNTVGVDISEEMLAVGKRKVVAKGLTEKVVLQSGDAEKLPFEDAQFDACMVSFGVRNFEDLDEGLREIHRIIRPGGQLVVLEFSRPAAFPIKQLYGFYNSYILPNIGKLLSGDSAAYTYLPESIVAFPEGEAFLDHMRQAGFKTVRDERLTFGIASIYVGERS
ncbi:bifunctional demethylmenaquinone methyltransferase/2-methoxy-6-polyprenyl-1,4-benzoquinol methylase UbiE [bacterium]|nr:bifunctional demethylmenaquinone methyltransferase/2-methoxy-6-polyprenyl-1,4-benzoquinol methylase UbiE [bacterium]